MGFADYTFPDELASLKAELATVFVEQDIYLTKRQIKRHWVN